MGNRARGKEGAIRPVDSTPATSDKSGRLRLSVLGIALVLGLAYAAAEFGWFHEAGPLPAAIAVPSGAADGFSVLLITLDTLRADHVHCYGYDGVETPLLDDLASRGVRFADAVSTVPMTAGSHITGFRIVPPTTNRQHHGEHRQP